MRKKIVAGNWKMHTTPDEGLTLARQVMETAHANEHREVIFFAPFVHLTTLQKEVSVSPFFSVGAQNCSNHEKGAFTGEVAAFMLRSIDVSWVLVGHSERRQYYHENHTILKQKVDQALSQQLLVMFCCGETLDQRMEGNFREVIRKQLEESLFHLDATQMNQVAIAYEPVWAIGTGQTATPDQAQEVHAFIRELIKQKYGDGVAARVRIVYGGSVKPDNAKDLFNKPDIDGGLVGGASLNALDFVTIIHAAE
ncbi:MAG: triose-phosphate isomerase [Flavobacteriales bacterium]|nr:triose-phosphate isomerase [Flavobacteriales bacterium]